MKLEFGKPSSIIKKLEFEMDGLESIKKSLERKMHAPMCCDCGDYAYSCDCDAEVEYCSCYKCIPVSSEIEKIEMQINSLRLKIKNLNND